MNQKTAKLLRRFAGDNDYYHRLKQEYYKLNSIEKREWKIALKWQAGDTEPPTT